MAHVDGGPAAPRPDTDIPAKRKLFMICSAPTVPAARCSSPCRSEPSVLDKLRDPCNERQRRQNESYPNEAWSHLTNRQRRHPEGDRGRDTTVVIHGVLRQASKSG